MRNENGMFVCVGCFSGNEQRKSTLSIVSFNSAQSIIKVFRRALYVFSVILFFAALPPVQCGLACQTVRELSNFCGFAARVA
jgi:hypothetical protein